MTVKRLRVEMPQAEFVEWKAHDIVGQERKEQSDRRKARRRRQRH